MDVEESRDARWEPGDAAHRLAVYETLVPGGPNHHQLSALSGRWIDGQVNGTLRQLGWGADLGYPGIVLDDDGPSIDVQVFESPDLPDHWARLDALEGPGYRRVPTVVRTAEGTLWSYIYVLAGD